MAFELRDQDVRDQYELLNILDAKASALLGFNAIFLAAIAIWLGNVPFNLLHLILDLVFLGLLASCSQLLRVIWLSWTPLVAVDAAGAPDHLEGTRKHRTRFYHTAWYISQAALVVVVVVTVVHVVGVLLNFLGVCDGVCAEAYGPQWFGSFDHSASHSPVPSGLPLPSPLGPPK